MNIFNNISRLSILAVILFIIALLGYSIFGNNKNTVKSSPLIGKVAPNFTLKSFDHQNDIKLEDYKGKVILLNFWASWCVPCKEEARALDFAWNKFKDDNVVFIGINIWDNELQAKSFLYNYNVVYKNGFDPTSSIQVDYGVAGVPETYIINPSGLVVEKYNGALDLKIIEYFIKIARLSD